MAHVDINKENFMETIENNDLVLLDFWAPWCGPCKAFGPIFEQVSEENDDAVFGKCNTEDERELAGALQIRAIPTLMVFREKVLVFRQSGALPEAALRELLEKVKTLDMDEVKADIAKEIAAQEGEEGEGGSSPDNEK